MKKLFAVAAIAACSVAPAFAQDAETPFTGPYIGVIGGFDGTKLDVAGADLKKDDFFAGVNAGYDIALGGAVVGLEAELTDSNAKKTIGDEDAFASVKFERDVYVGVRAGALISPNLLAYAKGGYTNTRIALTAGDEETLVSGKEDFDGFRVGAGLEYAQKFGYLRLEYRYSNYGNKDLGDGDELDLTRHQVAAGVGIRF